MRRMGGVLFVVIALVAATAGEALSVSGEGGRQGLARFEAGWIDLRAGWGEARACLITPDRPIECFRTERESDLRAAEVARDLPTLACSTPLKLRDGANQSGLLATVSTRGSWVNLSSISFDNKTSSFTVGACSIQMAAQANGAGNHYPSCLSPGCVENTMDPGWDNVISSVYLD